MRELRYALRQLRKSPGFTITAAATLALGIGAATAVYSIVDAVLLRPLPYPHPDRLVEISALEAAAGGSLKTNDVSYPNFFDWRSQTKTLQSIASYKTSGFSLAAANGGPASRTTGVMVSSGFFSAVGVAPVLGRPFRLDEEQPGNRSVVISHDLWQSQFGSAHDIVGRTIRLDEEPYTVVGVMQRGFQFPINTPEAQLWVTLAKDAEGSNSSASQRGYNQLEVVGRLRDGVTLSQAKAELDTIQRGLSARYPDDDKSVQAVAIVPETEAVLGDVRRPLRILFGAVCFLLLIACVNVAGLQLTRSSGRLPELSIRAALGASRASLLRQMLVESIALSLCGGLLGMALAQIAIAAAPVLLPQTMLRAQSISLNGAVLAFALLVSVVAGVFFGLLPAWRVSRLNPLSAMRDGQRSVTAGRGRQYLHSGLVIAETAMGLILLTGAGLLIRSFDRILRVDPGFDPNHLLVFRVAVPESRYTDPQREAFFDRLMARLAEKPGVSGVTAAFPMPLTGGDIHISFSIQGQPVATGDEPSERVAVVAPRFFETMHIGLERGRLFLSSEQNAKGQPVAIVNEAFARKYFAGHSAVGQHMRSGLGAGDVPPMREIVGVVANVKRGTPMEDPKPEYYVPIEQAPVAPPAVALRVAGDPAKYEELVHDTVSSLDPALPVFRMHPYADDLARTSAQQRFQAILIGTFAAIALVLAAVGLYALLSYLVAQRTNELGVRMALGAERGDVLRLILQRGLVLSAAGLVLGVTVSVFLTRILSGMLFEVNNLDAPTYVSVSTLLLGVSLLASLVPAYRASRLDPILALRRN